MAWEKVCPGTRVSAVCTEAVQYLTGEGRYADRTSYAFPEMVVMDLSLPIMNGFQVLQCGPISPGRRSLRRPRAISHSPIHPPPFGRAPHDPSRASCLSSTDVSI